MQQVQTKETSRQICNRCSGTSFYHTPILDPKTSGTVHLYRCKSCDKHPWQAPDAE